jgi:hypothetical protein
MKQRMMVNSLVEWDEPTISMSSSGSTHTIRERGAGEILLPGF